MQRRIDMRAAMRRIAMLATLTGQSGPIVKVWLTVKAASPGNTPMPTRSTGRCRSDRSQLRPDLPEFGEQHDVEHLSQIGNPRRTTGALLEFDDPLHRRHMVETPAAEIVLEIHQLFRELVQLPEPGRVLIDRQPCLSRRYRARRARALTSRSMTAWIDAKAAAMQEPEGEVVDTWRLHAPPQGVPQRCCHRCGCASVAAFLLPTRYSIMRYCQDCRPEDCPSNPRNCVYSLGVMVRRTSQAELSCSRMRDTRDKVLKAGCRSSAAISRQVAFSSESPASSRAPWSDAG